MWYYWVAAAAMSAYGNWLQDQQRREDWERKVEISKERWKQEVAARHAEMILVNQQLDKQISEVSQQESEYLSEAALDAAERDAAMEISLSESGIGGAIKQRIENQFAIEYGKIESNIKRQAKNAISKTEAQRRASSLRLRAPKFIPGADYNPTGFYTYLAYSGLSLGSQYLANKAYNG